MWGDVAAVWEVSGRIAVARARSFQKCGQKLVFTVWKGRCGSSFFHIARSDLDLSVARIPEIDLGRRVFEVLLLASLMFV